MRRSSAPVLVEGLSHDYGHGSLRRRVLHDVEIRIEPGEIVILTGPSGSGKTTLLTLMGALRAGQQGRLEVLGESLMVASPRRQLRVRQRIGYVFQQDNLLEALNARQNVQMALALCRRLPRRESARWAEQAMAQVGLAGFAEARPAELSGGQRQRVGIARALVHGPELILADEPTASLDRESGRDAVDLMQRLAREQGVTVVLVTHDHRILDVADRVLHLEDGRVQPGAGAARNDAERCLRLPTPAAHRSEPLIRIMPISQTERDPIFAALGTPPVSAADSARGRTRR